MHVRITWYLLRRVLFIFAVSGLTLYVYNKINKREVKVPSFAKDDQLTIFKHTSVRNELEREGNPEESAIFEKAEYASVDTLLFFVGYPRSRHTLLSSILDAHPHVLLANEENTYGHFANGDRFSRNEMFDNLVRSSNKFLRGGGKGKVMNGTIDTTEHFGFFMDGYWQGTYDKYIKVIGDKTAWYTSLKFREQGYNKSIDMVNEIERQFKTKVKFIHIIRNPFDIVSTITLRQTKLGDRRFGDHTEKLDDPNILEQSMRRFFRWSEGSAIAREALGDKLLDVVGLELVLKPVETMRKICEFIEITCSEEYLQACAKVVDPKPSITRNYVVWTNEHKNQMYSEIEQYPFLADYTFDD